MERVGNPGELSLPDETPPPQPAPAPKTRRKGGSLPPRDRALNASGQALLKQKRFKEAAAVFTRALGTRPSNAPARAGRGLAYLALGQTEKAIEDMEEASTQAPDLFPELKNKLSAAHLQQGRKLEAAGKGEEALDHYLAATRLDPANAAAWARAGGIAFSEGKFEPGLTYAERAVGADPRVAEGYASRGACLAGLGRSREALKDLDAAIALDGRQADFFARRAAIHDALDEPLAALSDAQKAVDLNPSLKEQLGPMIKESARKAHK